MVPTRLTAQTIRLGNGTEGEGLGGFAAEENHVGEVLSWGLLNRGRIGEVFFFFAEESAGGEYGVDSVDDEAGGGEGEVAGVVLRGGSQY